MQRKFQNKKILLGDIPEKVAEVESRFVDGELTIDLQGEGMKINMPCNIIDIYTRLEILLGLKLIGHTNTLTEASNLIDELYKRGKTN